MKNKYLKHIALLLTLATVSASGAIPVYAAEVTDPAANTTQEQSLDTENEETDTEDTEEAQADASTDVSTETQPQEEDPLSVYDDILSDDDTADAAIYNKGVIIGGVEKPEKTCTLNIETKGLEYLNEDFDKEIYILLTNVNNYEEYGLILDKEHDYKGSMNVPAGHYILSNVGLTHGRALDYFSIHKEVICPPEETVDFWFKLYSYKEELKKAERQQLEDVQDYVEATEPAEKVEPVEVAHGSDIVVNKEEPKKTDISSIISLLITLAGCGIAAFGVYRYQDKKKKKREAEENDDIF